MELKRTRSHRVTSYRTATNTNTISTEHGVAPHQIKLNRNGPHCIAYKLNNAIRMDRIVTKWNGSHHIVSIWFDWNIPHRIVLNHIESDCNGPRRIETGQIASHHIASYCNEYEYNQSRTWRCTASNKIVFNRYGPHCIASKLINAIGMDRIVTNRKGPHRIASIWFDWYIPHRIVLNHFTADRNGPHRIATDRNG